MNDIQVNEYFLTDQGDIGQVISISQLGTVLNTDIGDIKPSSIINHDNVLHNLLEQGDFVNGAKLSKTKDGYLSYNGRMFTTDVVIDQVMTKKKFYKECYQPKASRPDIEWRTCKGCPKYEVSNTGLIRSKTSGKILSTLKDSTAQSVRLDDITGHRVRKQVAFLVLEAFDSYADGRVPKFLNGDINDCSLSNLQWELPKDTPEEQPKSKTTSKNTYHNIVGYIDNKPVLCGLTISDVLDTLSNHIDFLKTRLSSLSKPIANGVPYKGITFKTLSDSDYKALSSIIDNSRFTQIYTQIKEASKNVSKIHKVTSGGNSTDINKVAQSDKITSITKSELPPKPKKSKLDDLDDSEFFKEMEQHKRDHFKEELLRRLKQ